MIRFLFYLLILFLINFNAYSQWNYVGNRAFSDSVSGYNRIAIYKSTPYVAFRDQSVENKCTAMFYDGTEWQILGQKGFSQGRVDYVDFKFIDNIPYVVYRDFGLGDSCSVMKYDGVNWVSVGGAFGGNSNFQHNIEGTSDTAIYVAFRDETVVSSNGITVMKYDGNSWQIVGYPNLSEGGAILPDLVIHNNELYVVYVEKLFNDKLTLKKFDGSNWVTIGTPQFTPAGAGQPNMCFKNDEPHINFVDFSLSNRISTMKFNGTDWQYVGTPGYSIGNTNHNSLVYNGTALYSCFHEGSPTGSKISVKKYNGVDWVYVGDSLFSDSSVNFNRMDISNDTIYVGFRDIHASNKMSVMANYTPCRQPSIPTIQTQQNIICINDSLQLSVSNNDTLGDAKRWVWRRNNCYGDIVGVGSSITIAPDSTTTYFVKGEGGCVLIEECSSIQIEVENPPTVEITPSTQTICATTTQISLTSIYSNVNSINWSTNGNGFFSNSSSDSTIYFISGNDINAGNVSLYSTTVNNACTPATDTSILIITPPPIVDAGADQFLCPNTSIINLSGQISGGASEVIWTGPNNNNFSPDTTNTLVSYTLDSNDNTNSALEFILCSTNGVINNCQEICDTTNIFISDTIAPTAYCKNITRFLPDSGLLKISAVELDSNSNDNCEVDSIYITKTNFTCENIGLNSIEFIVLDQSGNMSSCITTLEIIDTINFIDAGEDREIIENEAITINANSSNFDEIYWRPEENIENSNTLNPTVFPTTSTLFYVTIKVNNCELTDSVLVNVLPNIEELEIRNLITPNNDGKNDTWTVNKPELLDGCAIIVINRWGKTVFESIGYSTEWDATYNGQVVPDGTYYYIINCNGMEEIKSTITIIKN